MILGTSISFKSFLRSFSYWFCFGYVAMLIVSPMLQRLSKNIKFLIVIIGGGLAAFITVAGYFNPTLILVRMSLKGIIIGPIWFSYVFVLVSLIREYWDRIAISRKGWMIIFLVSYTLMYLILNI